MPFLPLIFILISHTALAEKVVSFEASKTYKVEGTMRKTFFVFNENTNNEQRIKLTSKNDLVPGAQYSLCLKVKSDCHMECEASISGTPKFITPDLDPALLTPDQKGAYAPADKTQCP